MPNLSRRALDLADVIPHLQPRDYVLLRLLSDHQVLTTTQIAAALYSSLRMCQHRLHQLRQLDLIDRIRLPRDRRHGGSPPGHWALGRLGHDLHTDTDAPPVSARTARHRLARHAKTPLAHLVGTNGFFTDLLAHARTHPHTALLRWWSEHESARRFAGIRPDRIQPDGHGLWRHHDRTVGFWLEYDRSTENLPRLVGKLGHYDRLGRSGGPTYPVLFSLDSPAREANLHQALAGVASRCPIATTARHGATHGPAGPVWALVGHGTTDRMHLHDLDSHHGPDDPRNPNWVDGQLTLDQQQL